MHQGGLQWCNSLYCRFRVIYIYIYISIIHSRCIKEVFSDATVFIADFGLFLHHIGSDRNLGMTLEEPSRLLDRDVLRSCLYQSKKKILIRPDFGRSYRHLSFSNSQWKTGHSTLLYIYIYICFIKQFNHVSLNNKDKFCLYNLFKILSSFLISVFVSGWNW